MKNFELNGIPWVEADIAEITDSAVLENLKNQNKIVKIFSPPEHEKLPLLRERGFAFADRILDVAIPLNKTGDVTKHIRLNIVATSDFKNEITQIAQESFVSDRRFHLFLNPSAKSQRLANAILAKWVADLDSAFVAFYKDAPVGFLALNPKDFVYLAAVAPKARMTGAAMALYAFAIEHAKSQALPFLNGRISAQNMAVMNLYAHFGAKFSNPQDIYIHESRKF